jgi:hypothetical protein
MKTKTKSIWTLRIDNEEQNPGPVLYTTAHDPTRVCLDKVCEELSLTEGQDCGVYQYQFQGKQLTWCGNRPIEPLAKYDNECMYCLAWRLCALKGDYESMLILACVEPT